MTAPTASTRVATPFRRPRGFGIGPFTGTQALVGLTMFVAGLLALDRNPTISVAIWVGLALYLGISWIPDRMPYSVGAVISREASWLTRRKVTWVNPALLGSHADAIATLPGELAKLEPLQTPMGCGVLKYRRRAWTVHLDVTSYGTPPEVLEAAVGSWQRVIDRVGWTDHVAQMALILTHRPSRLADLPGEPAGYGPAERLLAGRPEAVAAQSGRNVMTLAITFDPTAGPASGARKDNERLEAIDLDVSILCQALKEAGLPATPRTVGEIVTSIRDRLEPAGAPFVDGGEADLSLAAPSIVTEHRSHVDLGGSACIGVAVLNPPEAPDGTTFDVVREMGALDSTLAITMRPFTGAKAARQVERERSGAWMRRTFTSRSSAAADVDSRRADEQALANAEGQAMAVFSIVGTITLDPERATEAALAAGRLAGKQLKITVCHGWHLGVLQDTLGCGLPAIKTLLA